MSCNCAVEGWRKALAKSWKEGRSLKCVASLCAASAKRGDVCLVDQSCFWLHSMNKFPGHEGKERYLINDGNRLDIWQDGRGLSSRVHVASGSLRMIEHPDHI